MTLVLDLPPDLEAMLRADAGAQGRDAAAVAVERLTASYAADGPPVIAEGSPEEDAAIREGLADFAAGRFRPEADIAAELRAKYNLPEKSR